MYHGFLNFAGFKGLGLKEATVATRMIRLKIIDFFDEKLGYQMKGKGPEDKKFKTKEEKYKETFPDEKPLFDQALI